MELFTASVAMVNFDAGLVVNCLIGFVVVARVVIAVVHRSVVVFVVK